MSNYAEQWSVLGPSGLLMAPFPGRGGIALQGGRWSETL